MNYNYATKKIIEELDPRGEFGIEKHSDSISKIIESVYLLSISANERRMLKNYRILTAKISVFIGCQYSFDSFVKFLKDNLDLDDVVCDYCGCENGEHADYCMYIIDYLKLRDYGWRE